MSPERSDLILPSYVPHVELNVSIGNGLDVEADGRDGRHRLVQLELVEDGWRRESKARERESGSI